MWSRVDKGNSEKMREGKGRKREGRRMREEKKR